MTTPQEAHHEFFENMSRSAAGDELEELPDELACLINAANYILYTYVILRTKENTGPNIGPTNGFYPNGATEE